MDMRTGRDQLLKAEDIVNQWDEQEMAEIFMKYGDEHFPGALPKRSCGDGIRNRYTTQDLRYGHSGDS